MNDYSEVTATLNREVTDLISALNDKKWDKAFRMNIEINKKCHDLLLWTAVQIDKEMRDKQ